MACAVPAWAENERELEENVAPESATAEPGQPTILQRIVDSPLFQPRITLNLRSYDFGADVDPLPLQHTWAAGGRLGLETPEWRELLSVGAAVYGSYPLYMRGTVDTTRLVAPNGDGLLVPGETYVNLRRDGFNLSTPPDASVTI